MVLITIKEERETECVHVEIGYQAQVSPWLLHTQSYSHPPPLLYTHAISSPKSITGDF